MLFDLQGKRRRVVQGTYLGLAVLMGGGLVLFGVGGSVSGGLLDAFNGGGGNSGNDVVQERIDSNEKKVQARPKAEAPRKELVRDYYQLAVAETPTNSTTFPPDAQQDLRHASTHWNAYLGIESGKPDRSLANVALQVYGPDALNQPQQALKAARILAEQGKDANSYLLLVQYASLAGDKRTQALAEAKALDLAHNAQELKAIKSQIKQLKAAAVAQDLQKNGKVNLKGLPGATSKTGTGTDKNGDGGK